MYGPAGGVLRTWMANLFDFAWPRMPAVAFEELANSWRFKEETAA